MDREKQQDDSQMETETFSVRADSKKVKQLDRIQNYITPILRV